MELLNPELKKNVYDMLDWNSRLNFNLALHPKERIGLKLKKSDIESHEMYVLTRLLKDKLVLFNSSSTSIIKVKNMIKMDCEFMKKFIKFSIDCK